MRIHKYLTNISNGKPINGNQFINLLEELGYTIDDLGELNHVKKDLYTVNVTDQSLLQNLMDITSEATSREDAANRLKNSHEYGTNSAYFVYKTMPPTVSHGAFFCGPDTNLKDVWKLSAEIDVVLIENSECFTFSDVFLEKIGLSSKLDRNAIIVWSSGVSIMHNQAIRMLSAFRHIYYCPDYDLVGLMIYETLKEALGKKLELCEPQNLISYAKFCRKTKPIYFSRALEKARKNNLTTVATLFEVGRGILEQETLLGKE